MAKSSDAFPKGIRRTGTGWQVFVRVRGVYKSRRFPLDTTLRDLMEERERLKAEVKFGVPTPDQMPRTFREDAVEYLSLVKAMPTYSDRKYRIERWIEVFGNRFRSDITARDIRNHLEHWRQRGRHGGGALTTASLNQRRTALMAMYTVLDGKSGANIVRDVPPYDERYSQKVRSESMLTCARLVRRLRKRGKMRAVLHALLWTGWPHELFAGIQATDVDEANCRVRVGRRKKGKGMAPAWVPVVPRAILAFRQVARCKAWGGCSTSSLHSALARAVKSENAKRAAKKEPLILEPFGPYGLRHSFATWAAGIIKDDRALKELLRTNSIARYTEGAVADRLASARDLLAPPKPKRRRRKVLKFKAQ